MPTPSRRSARVCVPGAPVTEWSVSASSHPGHTPGPHWGGRVFTLERKPGTLTRSGVNMVCATLPTSLTETTQCGLRTRCTHPSPGHDGGSPCSRARPGGMASYIRTFALIAVALAFTGKHPPRATHRARAATHRASAFHLGPRLCFVETIRARHVSLVPVNHFLKLVSKSTLTLNPTLNPKP